MSTTAPPRRPALPLAPLLFGTLLWATPATAADPGSEAPTEASPEVQAEAAQDPSDAVDLFAMPRISEQTRAAFGRIQAGDLAGAARILDALAIEHPRLGLAEANRATLRALMGNREGAIVALQAAAAKGYDGLGDLLADPLFALIAEDPRLAALPRAAPSDPDPSPDPGSDQAAPAREAPARAERPLPRPDLALAPVVDGIAPVSAANTRWDPAPERLRAGFAFPASVEGAVVPNRGTAATDILREHWKRGRAAGNLGDLYDNRDRGHSAPDPKDHPQLARVTYSEAARAADIDYGLNESILFGAPTLGNSSTAITGGALWRSLPRAAFTREDGTGPLRLWQNASANALYVYPAHRDYGPEQGDLFPANTPYLLVSRGASGSDQPFLEAVAMIYAAYRPETKARLAAEGLIVPTTQMIFRRSLQNVRSRANYFSAAAHPAAYEAYEINAARMVSLAQSIKPDAIPPQVRIRVASEDLGTEGLDFFGEGLSEQLFDTPAAVARIWRSRAFTREITLDAGETADPNGRPLSFEWKLLAGDPAKVRITPAPDGRSARIALDWHEPFRISEDNPTLTHRVDIGVFANNGVHDSAPAILSVFFPPNETRVYGAGPDGATRIESIDHRGRPSGIADPALLPRTDFRDDYLYAPDGTPLGWTRNWGNGALTGTFAAEAFDAEGRRLGPEGPERLHYPLIRAQDGALILTEAPAP